MKFTKTALLAFLLVVAASAMFLAGCSKEDTLLGKWQETTTSNLTLEFQKDGALVATLIGVPVTGTYTIVDKNHLLLNIYGILGIVGPQTIEYLLAGESLTIKVMGGPVSFKKIR